VNEKRLQSLVFNNFRVTTTLLIITNLSACIAYQKTNPTKNSVTPDFICPSAASYANQVVGDGHCVSLIKQCSSAPHTELWRPGASVLNSSLPAGTVIATFKNGHYPNNTGHHAAIYIKQTNKGIWVWDQWLGKPVHKRLIRIRNDNASPGNTAQEYKVVKIK